MKNARDPKHAWNVLAQTRIALGTRPESRRKGSVVGEMAQSG